MQIAPLRFFPAGEEQVRAGYCVGAERLDFSLQYWDAICRQGSFTKALCSSCRPLYIQAH